MKQKSIAVFNIVFGFEDSRYWSKDNWSKRLVKAVCGDYCQKIGFTKIMMIITLSVFSGYLLSMLK